MLVCNLTDVHTKPMAKKITTNVADAVYYVETPTSHLEPWTRIMGAFA